MNRPVASRRRPHRQLDSRLNLLHKTRIQTSRVLERVNFSQFHSVQTPSSFSLIAEFAMMQTTRMARCCNMSNPNFATGKSPVVTTIKTLLKRTRGGVEIVVFQTKAYLLSQSGTAHI